MTDTSIQAADETIQRLQQRETSLRAQRAAVDEEITRLEAFLASAVPKQDTPAARGLVNNILLARQRLEDARHNRAQLSRVIFDIPSAIMAEQARKQRLEEQQRRREALVLETQRRKERERLEDEVHYQQAERARPIEEKLAEPISEANIAEVRALVARWSGNIDEWNETFACPGVRRIQYPEMLLNDALRRIIEYSVIHGNGA